MKKHNPGRGGFTLLQRNLVLAALAILAAIFLPVFNRARESDGHRNICPSNLKQIGLGLHQYIQDYDWKYPPLALASKEKSKSKGDTSAFGWADALQPYLKSTQIFQCPAEGTPPDPDPTQPRYTDYWFNSQMAGLGDEKLEDPTSVILLGDGNSNNARYHLSDIPQSWRGNPKSPLYRHGESTKYAFADGHVNMLFGSGTFRPKFTNQKVSR